MYCILKYVEYMDFQRQFADDDRPLPANDPKYLQADGEIIKTNAGLSQKSSGTTGANLKTSSPHPPSMAPTEVSSGLEHFQQGSELHNDPGKIKQLYFNPNCFVQLILDYICDEVGIKTESDFDLCNEEGDLLKIKDYEPLINGTVMFTPKETYFVVLQARNSKGKIADVQVLLSRTSEMYFSICSYLSTKIPTKSTSGEKQVVTFKKKRGSRSSRESKTNFDFAHDFGALKKPKARSSKSHQFLVHN